MRFGASSYFLKERSVTEALDVIARLGYDSVEIWMEHYWSGGQSPSTIARHARTLRLDLTLHAASYDLNIISTNRAICRESRRQIRTSLQLAGALGANVVVVHPGALSSSKGDRKEAWESLEEIVALLNDWAKEEGVEVGLENMENRTKEIFVFPEDIARLFRHPWKRVHLTLDLAHTATVMDPISYLNQINPKLISHVHLSDHDPLTTHLPLGKGQLPIIKILKALSQVYGKIVSLEGYNPKEGEKLLIHNMEYLRKNWEEKT